MKLLDRLSQLEPTAARTTLRRMIEAGRVCINGRPAHRATTNVADTDTVTVLPPRPPRPARGSALPDLPIIYEDPDLLVVNKPPGLLTSTVPRERRLTLLAMLRDAAGPHDRIGLIHRLDRDARGLLVFSRTDVAYQALKRQLAARTMRREYRVVVAGRVLPPTGKITSRLVEQVDGTIHSLEEVVLGGMPATTLYETVAASAERTLLAVRLKTGRKHQIRVHFAERGHPVIGDIVYGPPDGALPLLLAAVGLGFTHPVTGAAMNFDLPLPPEFKVV